jgi:hypothetical protein
MRPLPLLLLALAGAARVAAGAAPAAEHEGARSSAGEAAVVRADTIVWRDLLRERPVGPPLRGPGLPEPPGPPIRLGLAEWADPLPAFHALVPDPPRTGAPAIEVAGRDEFVRDAVRRFLVGRSALGAVPPRRTVGVDPEGAELPEIFSRYADLAVRVRGRAELGGDWTRFRPCSGQFQISCTPTLLPRLVPDLNVAVQLEGTVAERVQVEVDYDQLREFGAANTLSIVYHGQGDEMLRRVEVGDVTFRLPRSRFLTEGIPAGNFGFQAEARMGPVELRSVWAEQKGDLSSREFRLTGVGNQRRFVQEDTLEFDDADWARGQFFFLLDPGEITGHPHLDILELDAGMAPATLVPGVDPVQLYRYENDPAARQQVEGFIQADAVAEADGDRVVESGWFRYLVPGQDYFVHPSGLWVALRAPLARDEMLAVAYVTAAGDTVGTYNPERVYTEGGRPELRLLKASRASHQPGRPTWDLEMHQVYRISASPDVVPQSVDVTVSLGELSAGRTFKRAPDGRDITYLQLFGLDQESPLDRVDPSYVYSPARDLFQQDLGGVQGTFLVFPTLRPFLDPPGNEGLRLSPEAARAILAEDANARIYEAEDPYERDAGGRFRLTIPYRVRSEGVISSFSLGALGLLEGSERILLGERVLVRGVDYEIDYDVGQVTLLDAEALFAAAPDSPVRATWEQRQVFREAPTSVFGFNAHVGESERGRLDLLALYRSEKTLVRRPVLGLEPGAALMGGLSGRLERNVGWLDALLDALPALRSGEGSRFAVEGEVAMSVPDPNTRGDVFLDDFDATEDRPLSLLSHDWTRGSAPERVDGAEAVLPVVLDESSIAELVWQHTWILESSVGDSVAVHEGFLPREEIDQQIRVAGSRVREPGLRLAFRAPPFAPGFPGRRWASVTTTLSPTGTDLTKSDFLEFYVADGDPLTLVVDLGMVSEDAFFVDDQGNTSGVKSDGVRWGIGVLDQEADPARGEIWGNASDALGVWGETCLAEPGRIYRLGDTRANCTRGNGRNDSEDLDGDGNLDTTERTLRYLVRLDGSSPFLARSRSETGTGFRLYRIPIRSNLATEVNGPVTEADLRAVRQIRLTVTGDRPGNLTVARMRVVGSRWIKRGAEGLLTGIAGDTTALGGRLETSPVSRVTEGDAYASPPGVLEQLADPTSALGSQGVEFNEKSLSLRVEGLGGGDRAEVYSRFPQRPRDFLSYREARLWVVARSGDWGPDRPVSFFFKIGTDSENFYLYRTPLPQAPGVAGVMPTDWLPEVVVDFEVFQELRSRAEETLALAPRGAGDPPLVLWARDSTYAVVLKDQGRAPNLASVREMSLGIWNQGPGPFQGEVWVNELRLGRGVRDAGLAGMIHATADAGDVLQNRVSLSSRGAFFRQLDERATHQTDRRMTLDSRLRVDRALPADWGLEVPLTLSMDRVTQDPTYLAESDVPADRLRNLREIGSSRTRVGLAVRKTTPAEGPLMGFFVNDLETSLAWYRTRHSSVTSRAEAQGVDFRIGYDRRLAVRELPALPGVLEPLVRFLLPGPLEEAVLGARLRWSPERVAVATSYARQDNQIFRYERIVEVPADSLVFARPAPRETLETVAEIALRPLETLTANLTFVGSRDLLLPTEVVADPMVQLLLEDERARVGGIDVGWETHRTLTTRVDYRPRVVSWLRHEVGFTTRYDGDRNPGFVGVLVSPEGDSVPVLVRNVRGERERRAFVSLDAADLTRGTAEVAPLLARVFGRFRPLTYTWQDGIFSRFNRDAVSPGAGYQLGWTDREGFRLLDGDTATTLVDRVAHQVAWGVQGARAALDATYAWSEIATLDVRADRGVRTEIWPDLRARLEGVSVPGFVGAAVERISLSTGLRRSRREVTYGQAAQRRVLDDRSYPFDVTLFWAGGLSTGYRGSLETGRGRDPTGDTERDRVTHRVSLNSLFRPPFGLDEGLSRPIRLSILASYVAERECRVPAGREGCVAFVDQLNRALSMALDTQLSGFDVGIQASYTNRQSFVGQRRGSTQLQLSVFGQFLVEAGTLGAVFPR